MVAKNVFKLGYMKIDKIKKTISGKGTTITESCPFWKARDECKISEIDCRYDLTDVKVPGDCPLLKEPITITITLLSDVEDFNGG